jgi:hypothetical protein
VIRSSLTDWRPMKKKCRHARHNSTSEELKAGGEEDIDANPNQPSDKTLSLN